MTCHPARSILAPLLFVCLVADWAACGSGGGPGGTSGSGGSPTTGGATTTASRTGGAAVGAGGKSGTGGRPSTGGVAGAESGGSLGSGGVDGRTNATGGTTATAVATGGATPQGGTVQAPGGSTGGNVSGGTAGSANGGTAGGASATGGRAGNTTAGASGGGAGGGTTSSSTGGSRGGDAFALAWQDDFDALDASLWQAQSFTWEGNQAQFTPENVSVANGKVKLALTSAPSGSAKPYLGVELRSTKTLTYGKVSANMRFAPGSGVVSGLVLFYTPYPNCDWNEIDIEHLGNSSQTSQLNCMVYTGTPAPGCTASVSPTQDPQVVNLGFDAETTFHQYDIEWTPSGVKFFVDGTLLRTWTANISRLKLPQNILLTIWASSSASWAGALGASSVPSSAEVDWIKVYDWKG